MRARNINAESSSGAKMVGLQDTGTQGAAVCASVVGFGLKKNQLGDQCNLFSESGYFAHSKHRNRIALLKSRVTYFSPLHNVKSMQRLGNVNGARKQELT